MSASADAPLVRHRSVARLVAQSVRSVRSRFGRPTPRRGLQAALGLIWLVDAALQYQPYMFHAGFVTQELEPANSRAPYFVAHPAIWADHLMLHHVGVYDAGFATLQLVIAVAIVHRPTVRVGLAVSMVWAGAIWWLGEGIGGVTDGASPVTGAPGAAVLYALAALLVWPTGDRRGAPSVAERGPLGAVTAKVAWVLLWGGFVALGLEAANRSPSAMHDAVTSGESGQPSWIKAIDRALAAPLAHHGTEASIALAALCAVVGAGVIVPVGRRPAVAVAALLGVVFWLVEDFGGIFTGTGTDVNSGPLLVLLAVAFWPTIGVGGERTVGVHVRAKPS